MIEDEEQPGGGPPGLVEVALVGTGVALLLGLFRASLQLLRDGYLEEGLGWVAATSAARHTFEALALGLPLGIGLTWLTFARPAIRIGLLPYGALTVLFLTFRLPADEVYQPTFDGTRGVLAHVGAVVATALVSVVLWLGAARVLLIAGALTGAAALGVVASVPMRAGSWDDGRPNLVLISLDTLRADHLGAYGATRNLTPRLDALATRSMRFDAAFTQHPWTLTAHMSMLTGLHPGSHGVDRRQALPRDAPTLAEVLRDEGYATIAVVDANPWLSARYGFDRGFVRYRTLRGNANRKIDEILHVVRDVESVPFFLFAHFYDAHSDWERLPYDGQPEDVAELAGWYEGDFTGCEEDRGCGSELLMSLNDDGGRLTGEDLRYVADLYAAGVRSLDRELGRLFDGFERMGIFDEAVVVVTSDHGEEFFEHGRALHSQHYDECLRVPLFVCTPDVTPSVSKALVSHVDLAPTLLDFAGLSLPGGQGVSIAPIVRGQSGTPRRIAVLIDDGEGAFGLRSEHFAILPTDDGHAVFDLDSDPRQRSPLGWLALEPDVRAELQQELANRSTAVTEHGRALAASRPTVGLAPEEAAELRGLGYAE